ncbi:MAG: hypothetical protein H6581_16065 [Bacteroidia bacterium]|nr:hypothetical protein [Bacteroidia bacterium]
MALPRHILKQIAADKVAGFSARFPGEAHLHFAMHAAFPFTLNPDLCYRVWYHFRADIRGKFLAIPWIAVSDLLLSELCEESGAEAYTMRPEIRDHLLDLLVDDPRFGQQRLAELAQFMQWYAEQELDDLEADRYRKRVAETQRWTALAYLNPENAAETIAKEVQIALEEKKTTSAIRLSDLLQKLEKPLESVKSLIFYSKGIEQLLQGQKEEAKTLFDEIKSESGSLKYGQLELQIPEIELDANPNQTQNQGEEPRINVPRSGQVDILLEAREQDRSFAAALEARLQAEGWKIHLEFVAGTGTAGQYQSQQSQTFYPTGGTATFPLQPVDYKLKIRLLHDLSEVQGNFILGEKGQETLEIGLPEIINPNQNQPATKGGSTFQNPDFFWPETDEEREFAKIMEAVREKIREFDRKNTPDAAETPTEPEPTEVNIWVRQMDREYGDNLRNNLLARGLKVEIFLKEAQNGDKFSQKSSFGHTISPGSESDSPQIPSTELELWLLGSGEFPSSLGEKSAPRVPPRLEISLAGYQQPNSSTANISYAEPDFHWPEKETELEILLREIDFLIATPASINRLIREAKDGDEAQKLVDYLKEKGGKPNLNTYNLLIQKSKTFISARDWFGKLIDSALEPTLDSFHSLLQKASDYSAARDWMSQLYERGIKPVIETYNLLFQKTDHFEEGQRLFEEMRSREVVPNLETYHLLLDKTELGWQRKWAFDEMARDGITPSVETYALLIEKSEDFREAQNWFEELRNWGFKPDSRIWRGLESHVKNAGEKEWLETQRGQRPHVQDILAGLDSGSLGLKEAKSWFSNEIFARRWLPTVQTVVLYGEQKQGISTFLNWVQGEFVRTEQKIRVFRIENYWDFEQRTGLNDSFESYFNRLLGNEKMSLEDYLMRGMDSHETLLFSFNLAVEHWNADGVDRLLDYLVDLNLAVKSGGNRPKIWMFFAIEWAAAAGGKINFIGKGATNRKINSVSAKIDEFRDKYRELYLRSAPQFLPLQLSDIENWLEDNYFTISAAELAKKYFKGLKKVDGGYNYDDVADRLARFLQDQRAS